MIWRHAAWFVAALAAAAACKKEPTQPAAPSVATGSSRPAAQPQADPWAKEAPAAKLVRPLFWSIEKDGKTTYALGTLHVGVDAVSQLPPIVWKRFDSAAAFAMETDLSDPAVQEMKRPAGSSLHKELGDAEWKKLEQALTPAMAQKMDDLKPMVAATMLQLRGLPMTAPMDGVLLGRAQNENKRVVYLEPAALEEALLEKWLDVRALKEMLDDLDHGAEQQREMLAAYVAGDDERLLALSNSERAEWTKHGRDLAEYDRMMDEMLYARNASWIASIEKLHAAGGAFIATGALHMIGKRSVLDLLAQKGYKVTRITP